MKEYIAYRGRMFQIEWYFTVNGKRPALDYAETLSEIDKVKFENLLRLMGDLGSIHNQEKFRFEGDQIYAFKPQPHRFLCFFFDGKKIIITNGFVKKKNQLPKSEKEKAIRHKQDYIHRVKDGTYYDEKK